MNVCKFRHFLTVSSINTLLALLSPFAVAQPDIDNAPKAQNPPNWQVGGNGGMGGRGGNRGMGGGGGFGANITPEQHQQQLRQSLIQLGVTDTKEQDAVVAYVTENETAQQKLRAKWNALSVAIRDTTTPDTQVAGLLNDFHNAIEDEMARRDKARVALNAKLGLPKKPRLETQLMLSGLVGNEAALMQGSGGFGPGGFNPGGFGGRGRGGF